MNHRAWNPLYTLRWDDAAGEHQITGTSRDIHSRASRVHGLGEAGLVWDIAVLDDDGTDVTGRFFNHLDQQTTPRPDTGPIAWATTIRPTTRTNA